MDEKEEPTFFDPWSHVEIHGSKLPHWQQPGATCFVTFRLADSVPGSLLDRWKNERENWLRFHPEPWSGETEAEYHRLFSTQIDDWLDQGHGDCLLQIPAFREPLISVLQHCDRDRYRLHARIVMPNHAHVLFTLANNESLQTTMKTWKGVSARKINRLRSEGDRTLWMKGYFDRLIRDSRHFRNVARYIRNNPDKAKLKSLQFSHFETDSISELLES